MIKEPIRDIQQLRMRIVEGGTQLHISIVTSNFLDHKKNVYIGELILLDACIATEGVHCELAGAHTAWRKAYDEEQFKISLWI